MREAQRGSELRFLLATVMTACSPILLPTGPLNIPSTQGFLINFPDSSAAVGEASLADGEGRYLAQAIEEARLGRLLQQFQELPTGSPGAQRRPQL